METRRGSGTRDPRLRARPRLLPRGVQLLGLVLLVCAAAPGVARLYAALGQGALAAVVSEHRAAVPLAALVVGCLTLLAVERPRTVSPAAYARQLRDHFLELQSDFDAGLRRRPGKGKENGDDVQHPSEP